MKPLRVLAFAGAALAAATTARAQDDGPRVYQPAPVGAGTYTVFAVAKRGNEEPDAAGIVPGSDIDTDILVFRYARTFDLAGQQFTPFVIIPTGKAQTTIHGPGAVLPDKSSGLGDIQIGTVLGLVGTPALDREAFAARPLGFSLGLFAKAAFPTGAYDPAQPVNFGSNRLSLSVGLPMTLAIGQSFRDPSLTTIELFPTVAFYEANGQPHGAAASSKDPLFSFEGHVTRNLADRIWVSADVLYRKGGESTTDGVPNANAMDGWSGGVTAAVPVGPTALILTYEQVLTRRDDGPDGGFFRAALVIPF